jgi:rhamnosyl/mannosyltransferase
MRVLHVYKDFYPVLGGIENHLRLLSTELARREGLEVDVLVTSPGPRSQVERWDGVRVFKAARLFTLASTPISLALFRQMGHRAYDLTHLHFPYPLGELAYLLRGRSPRMIITYHSDIVRQRVLRQLYAPFLHRILDRADAIIVSSPHYVKSSAYLQGFRDKCVLIPFGIPVARFQDGADPAEVARLQGRYPLPLILFVGRFRYYKGIHYLIEAMKRVPRGTLLLAGAGPQEGRLREQARREGLDQRVVFLGEVPDSLLPSLYHASQLLVLPACQRAEAFGLVLLEAMACGLPVVSTELGTGTSFVNLHEETGLVVPPQDPTALASAINRLLADEALRTELGQRAKSRVEAEFSLDRMVERTLALYRRLVEEGAP